LSFINGNCISCSYFRRNIRFSQSNWKYTVKIVQLRIISYFTSFLDGNNCIHPFKVFETLILVEFKWINTVSGVVYGEV